MSGSLTHSTSGVPARLKSISAYSASWIRPDELVLRKLVPQAADGLARWGVAAAVIDRYLSVIERRCLHRRTGAAWQLDALYRVLSFSLSRFKAAQGVDEPVG
jgi:hypothetical protein